MRPTLLLAVGLLSTGAFAASQDRDVPAFDSVSVSAGMHATIEIGPARPVHLEADAQVLPLIETVVDGKELRVRFKEAGHRDGFREVTVTIQTPQLTGVSGSGGSIIRASFTRAGKSSIQASGGSEIDARGVDAGQLSVQGSGGSILQVAGRADTLELQMSGGTRFRGRDFAVRDLTVEGSGGSEGRLQATGKVNGGLSGGSQLHVRGKATARVSTSGGSQVEIED
jgi:hypothetical protein